VEIEKVEWSDADAVRRLVEVTNAARGIDSPWLHPLTEHECVGELRHGWDGEPKAAYLAAIDGIDVGAGGYEASSYDNLHLAWLEVEIVPSLRRLGHRLYRLVARHRASGELAGQTVVAVDGERPELGEQHDTSVVAAHRGHRLGALLKLEMLRWLSEAEPQLREIDTWNAESNDHMIGVNEVLGYRVLGRVLDFQRPTNGTA
jgi:GNAT superfamily N-acetyltransferase